MAVMTSTEFIAKVKEVADKYKTIYMWGMFGGPVTTERIKEKKAQYPSYYTSTNRLEAVVGKGYFAFDCVGLIKGILWGWNGSDSASHGGANYQSNGVSDQNAGTMMNSCLEPSTDFTQIEAGEVVWMEGHIGVYVGNDWVVESTPDGSDGVQMTSLRWRANRSWTKHGKLPYIDYTGKSENLGSNSKDTINNEADTSEFAGGSESTTGNSSNHTAGNIASNGSSSGSATGQVHIVVYGDTLWDISKRYLGDATRYPELMTYNKLSSDTIYPGQEIKIPGAGDNMQTNSFTQTYTVKAGDSLWAIAQSQLGDGARYTEIKKLNGLTTDAIHAGQTLIIPLKADENSASSGNVGDGVAPEIEGAYQVVGDDGTVYGWIDPRGIETTVFAGIVSAAVAAVTGVVTSAVAKVGEATSSFSGKNAGDISTKASMTTAKKTSETTLKKDGGTTSSFS